MANFWNGLGYTVLNEFIASFLHGKDGYATDKAIIISKAMRKITNLIGRQKVLIIYTNQLRVKMNAMFGDPWCVDPLSTEVEIEYDENSEFYSEYHTKLLQIINNNS